MTVFRSALVRAALLALAGAALLPAAAQAYWRGGVWFGLPGIYVAPPVYVAPPPVYVAPPVYAAPPYVQAPYAQGPYAPGPSYSAPQGPAQACYAGPWVCPLEQPTASGAACACAANGGRVWGQAN